jgi:hypothetical protein
VTASRPAYRQTLRQHRKLLIAPIIIASAVAAWFSFRAAPQYRSVAAVWVDNSPAVSSAMDDSTSSTSSSATPAQVDPGADGAGSPTTAVPTPNGPAGLEAQVVYELLLSPQFDLEVGHGSSLPRSLSSGSAAPRLADEAAAAEFAPKVSAWSTGPQVLQLSYDGPSPAVSQSVLRSLIKHIGGAGAAFGDTLGKTASSFYDNQLTSASTVLAGNQGSLSAYASKHPGANAGNDATYRALANEVRLAQQQETSAASASNQANTEASTGGSATIKVIDQPSLPTGPVTGLASKLQGVIGGAFAGLVVSLVALIMLIPRGRIRWDADVPAFARLAAWDRKGARRRRSSAGPRAAHAPRPESDLRSGQGAV